jgi:hypothetical protein
MYTDEKLGRCTDGQIVQIYSLTGRRGDGWMAKETDKPIE